MLRSITQAARIALPIIAMLFGMTTLGMHSASAEELVLSFRIDDCPMSERAEQVVAALFESADRDRNKKLDQHELQYLPHPDAIRQQLWNPLSAPLRDCRHLPSPPTMDVVAFSEWYRRQGYDCIHVGSGAERSSQAISEVLRQKLERAAFESSGVQPSSPADRLFAEMDLDGDRQLAASELVRDIVYPSTTGATAERIASSGNLHPEWQVVVENQTVRIRCSFEQRGNQELSQTGRIDVTSATAVKSLHDDATGDLLSIERFTRLAEFPGMKIAVRVDEGSQAEQLFEARKRLLNGFDEADQDHDQRLSAEELATKSARRLRSYLRWADRDEDSQLDKSELNEWIRLWTIIIQSQVMVSAIEYEDNLWERSDLNADGQISSVEWMKAWGAYRKDSAPIGAHVKGRRPVTLRVTCSLGQSDLLLNPPTRVGPSWFQASDSNRDGVLELSEWVGPLAIFRRLDGDSDHLLSPAEVD